MATLHPNVSSDMRKDAYTFYHLQLRITFEGAFGVLVQRWGMLWKQISHEYSVEKIMDVISCLCRLNNYFVGIDEETVQRYATEEYI